MTPLDRQPAPDFWAAKDKALRKKVASGALPPEPLGWKRHTRTLRDWFHETVRARGEPNNCAYCDGALELTSPPTIDHFLPVAKAPVLALAWENLYPACSTCNTTHKGTKWSCRVLRPDVDPVLDMIECDLSSGRLEAAPGLTPLDRRRVRLTVWLFGLNTTERQVARRRVARDLMNAIDAEDFEGLTTKVCEGPYRFLTRQLVLAEVARRFGG